jgi:cytochrome c553
MRHLRESRWTRLRGRRWYIPAGGHGKTTQCVLCHGPDLRDLGGIPGIAGRSPSYIVRQLYDFQRGQRSGVLAAPMAEAVAKLNADDLIFAGSVYGHPSHLSGIRSGI